MLFSTLPFFVFFLITLVVFYLAPRSARSPILLLASYVFYGAWNWKFIPLLLTLTVIDYLAAMWIEDRAGHSRRVALFISVAANLGFLFFFKYYNFAASSISQLAGLEAGRLHFDVVLPLGISFHTFQSISYVVDVYRGEQRAIRRPVDYALFIAFFPQLVAGPIVRAERFFADLYGWRAPNLAEVKRGLFLVVMGLTKKVALADNFAKTADQYFSSVATQPPGLPAWSAVVSFALQIYFDFSGYTDMAIGFALLLGFHFPINFRRPYLAVSITDFWHRWHISLSSWLRDYVYISFGGNRKGVARTYLNLFLTMLLGGLWHGANWTFLAWGGYHGSLLVLERMTGQGKAREGAWSIWDAPRTVLTFALVCIGWVFFRAASFHDATMVLRALSVWHGQWTPIEPAMKAVAVAAFAIALLEEHVKVSERIERAPLLAYSAALGTMMFCVELLSPDASRAFVYFQF